MAIFEESERKNIVPRSHSRTEQAEPAVVLDKGAVGSREDVGVNLVLFEVFQALIRTTLIRVVNIQLEIHVQCKCATRGAEALQTRLVLPF